MKKRCGCVVDKDGHPVHLCPMHEGLLVSRLKKAKHKVFSGIRRSNPVRDPAHKKLVRQLSKHFSTDEAALRRSKKNPRKHLTIYNEERTPTGFQYWIKTRGGRRARVSPAIVLREIVEGRATTRTIGGKNIEGTKVRRLPLMKNPSGFVLCIRQGGKRLYFDGSKHFTDTKKPHIFGTKERAESKGMELLNKYEVLSRYKMTVEHPPRAGVQPPK